MPTKVAKNNASSLRLLHALDTQASKNWLEKAGNYYKRREWHVIRNTVIRNVIRNIRAKQGIILGIDDDMQFTDRKLFLTDHHKLYGPYDQYIKTI